MTLSPTSWPGGGSASVTPPVTLTGTDGATTPLAVKGASDQSADFFVVESSATVPALQVQADGLGNATTIILRTNDPGLGGLIRFLTDEVQVGPLDLTATLLRAIALNAAPGDGFLGNGDFALWLDATPAATKLMVKAKDSGGTVRTAAIALS